MPTSLTIPPAGPGRFNTRRVYFLFLFSFWQFLPSPAGDALLCLFCGQVVGMLRSGGGLLASSPIFTCLFFSRSFFPENSYPDVSKGAAPPWETFFFAPPLFPLKTPPRD